MVERLTGLICAAGAGRRAGLPYPKTLHPFEGVPILGRILALVAPYDARPVVVVSPAGRAPIAAYLADAGLSAELVEQPTPSGMGDAVLCLDRAAAGDAEDVLMIWGDLPAITPETVATTVAAHRAQGADITFPTRLVDRAYTVVTRGADGCVQRVAETRETGQPAARGEREIGLFVFRRAVVFDLLRRHRADLIGQSTGEAGFLPVIGLAAAAGRTVVALPIAQERELLSLNHLADLDVSA